jgi:hypothetical protein
MLTEVPTPSNSRFYLKHSCLYLSDVEGLERSEQAFNDAFLSASQFLLHYLKLIESAAMRSSSFLSEVWAVTAIGLFRKLQNHYRSAILLEIHHDQVGSQFLLEQLRKGAVTLAYLLEEEDEELFVEYAAASMQQAFSLLEQTEEQIQQFPEQESLLNLRDRLEQLISKQKDYPVDLKKFNRWGPEQANTTTKREAILKLKLLNDPARLLVAQVIPASWLDVHLHYADLYLSKVRPEAYTNFTNISNAAYLCLHVAQILLGQIVHNSAADHTYLQEDLSTLFLWHNAAHKACSDWQATMAMDEDELHDSYDN